MKKFILFLFILASPAGGLNTSPAYAQSACVKVYGGGQGFCLPTITPTPTPKPQQPDGLPTTTKGGLPVLSSPDQTTNPATGPEALSLLILGTAGGLGFLIRKFTNKK